MYGREQSTCLARMLKVLAVVVLPYVKVREMVSVLVAPNSVYTENYTPVRCTGCRYTTCF